MRGVVGHDAVHRAVDNRVDDGLGICSGAQRRVHLESGVVVVADCVFREEHVVRGDLAGDVDASGLACADELDTVAGGEVLNMQVRAGEPRELDVAGDVDLLAGGRPAQHAQARGSDTLVDLALVDQGLVLAVVHDRMAKLDGVVHDTAHHAGVLDTAAVIGEGDGAMCVHVAHLGEDLALEALRAGAGDVDVAVVDFLGARLDVLHAGGGVGDGLGVGHAADVREAAVERSARTGGDVLLVLEAGLTQMDVDVHQTGDEVAPGEVADGIGVSGEVLPHLRDHVAVDKHIDDLVQTDLGVDGMGVLNQRFHRCLQAAGRGRPCGRGRPSRPGRGLQSGWGGRPYSCRARLRG